jgi:hypothetical protein
VVGLRVGTLRQRGELIPKDQYWLRSAQAWLEHLPATRKREKQPVFSPKGGFADGPFVNARAHYWFWHRDCQDHPANRHWII